MARNYRELQERMNPASRAENKRRVGEELQRMALDELRNAKRLTQAEMAEKLAVPQSSISRIEQRTDMYLSTLRNYVHAMGGVLQIQAVFPEGTVAISRLDEVEDRYYLHGRRELEGTYRLDASWPARPAVELSLTSLDLRTLKRTLRDLGVSDSHLPHLLEQLDSQRRSPRTGKLLHPGVPIFDKTGCRHFSAADLIREGFQERAAE
jgi:transcriptional regulator with XRE-family HTH domain